MKINKHFIYENFSFDSGEIKKINEGKERIIKAISKKDKSDVILKFTSLGNEYIENYKQNFERVRGLPSHRNIIQHIDIYILDESELSFSILEVLEYANAGTLINFLRSTRKFSDVIKIFKQTLAGYSFLHKNNLLHRDVKATNILVHKNNSGFIVKISDIEFWESESNQGTKSTPEYLAPEVSDYSKYTVQSEVWAIGVMLYELFTGEYPFGSRLDGLSVENIRDNTKNIEPKHIDRVPSPFRKIVSKSLIKDTKYRPKSVEPLLNMLSTSSILFLAIKKRILDTLFLSV